MKQVTDVEPDCLLICGDLTSNGEYSGAQALADKLNALKQTEGMEDVGNGKLVKAYVPLAEMFGYSTDLRSKTQGRGNYSMFFEKYEQAPKSVMEKVLSSKK